MYNSAATVSDDVGPARVLRSILSGVSTSADASTIAHARTVAAAFASPRRRRRRRRGGGGGRGARRVSRKLRDDADGVGDDDGVRDAAAEDVEDEGEADEEGEAPPQRFLHERLVAPSVVRVAEAKEDVEGEHDEADDGARDEDTQDGARLGEGVGEGSCPPRPRS